MQLKSIIDSPCGLRYVFENLDLQSSVSRRFLLEKSMMSTAKEIEASYQKLKIFYNTFLLNSDNKKKLQTLRFRLQSLRDIKGTLNRLEHSAQLDDIELFEIKHLALLTEEIFEILKNSKIPTHEAVELSETTEIISLLDPDGLKIASFYIYDSYSSELHEVREDLKNNSEKSEELLVKEIALEDQIRINLSQQLKKHVLNLRSSLLELTNIDIILAKAIQIQQFGMCFPNISKCGKTSYEGLFNPEVRAGLIKNNKIFQPIEIEFGDKPIIIIGANMGGKTVVLKTLTLAQLLFQFGFGIPAQKAEIDIKDEIHFCIGDEQSTERELSSFAAEMIRIDKVIKTVKTGKKIIALIDEPARTTNPIEGTALVSSLIKILKNKQISLLITTHYNIESFHCQRLRVKGMINGRMNYKLIEAQDGEVPHEALNIATELNIDKEWIDCAKEILLQNK